MQKMTRVKGEMAMLSRNPPPGIHCWQETTDIIKVEMTGPEGSPYENGCFLLEVAISEKYPFTPPDVKFLTPVYHPNIDPHGRICLSALKPKPSGIWNVTLNIPIVLSAIRVLLMEPNLADPLMTDIAKEYSENYKNYRERAQAETKLHARALQSSKN